MKTKLIALSCAALCLIALSSPAEPAVPAGPFQSPYNNTDNFDAYRITACFDLDRTSTGGNDQADWTGWAEGDPTPGSGHAYDGHTGTDWGLATGTNLYACQNGTVNAMRDSVPNDDHSDTGNYLIFDHTIGGRHYQSRYWHLSQGSIVPTFVGQTVALGEKVAESDNTGNSTGPHLHFGLSDLDASGLTTCGFFNGWFNQDEYYYGDGRPCLRYIEVNVVGALNIREGTSTLYDIITDTADGVRYVASQRNGWYRVFLPSAPATALESRTSGGAVTSAPNYVETGSWASAADKTAVPEPVGDGHRTPLTGAGSRRTAAGSAATAQFVPTFTQQGPHEIFVTWPSQANASNVTYTVNHAGGASIVTLDQNPGSSSGGTGTHADPHIINTNHYVVDHTTVGGDDIWNSYSPSGAGVPEEGPERIYQFTLPTAATVTATVTHTGYPGLDVDVQLLNTFSNSDCVARNDWSASYTFGAGTHWIAIDSYGSGTAGNNRATSYTLTVDIDVETANSWVSLGTFDFDRGQSAANGSITADASTAAGSFVYADAIKVVPVTWRSAWVSDAYATVLDGELDGICCVGVRTDATAGNDARSITDIVDVPIHQSPNANSPVVGKACSGQRFVCTHIENDFYRVSLPNSCSEPYGWISGEHLFVYNPEEAVFTVPAELTQLNAD